MKSIRNFLAATLAVGMMFGAMHAQAQQQWGVHFTATGLDVDFTFNTAGNAAIPELMQNVSGQVNGNSFSGLAALGSDGGFNFNNLFQNAGTFFDLSGPLLSVGGIVGNLNLYSIGQQVYAYAYSGFVPGVNVGNGLEGNLQVTPVPEPETYAMLLAGLGLMAFVARRRQKKEMSTQNFAAA